VIGFGHTVLQQEPPLPPGVMAFFRTMGAAGARLGVTKRWGNVPAAARSEGARKAARARWAKKKG